MFFRIAFASLVLFLGGCAATNQPGTDQNAAAVAVERRASTPDGTSLKATGPDARPAGPAGNAPLQPLAANQAASQVVVLLTAPADLWERIRRGYGMPNLESELVREREQWYASRPDYILRMTERSRKYLFHIVEELERRNMPTELALLPFIESAFNPQAVSSAKAAGMWQFMPATGRDFELKQNVFRDDRRDVLASTRAALDYLQKLHGLFGDWHLALAAYNWGEGSVARAINKNRRANLGTGYLDLTMPAETRHYVPKLQAVKNIVSSPLNYGSSLPVIENHPYFQTVTITKDIDVAMAAKLAQVQVEDFKALNPSANRPVILAAGTPQILLPWDNAAIFEANLLAQAGAPLATWTAWQAPFTMRPADAAKRVGMTEAQLRAVNAIPVGVVIQAGSSLLVPRSAALLEDVAGDVADNGRLSLIAQPLLARQTIRAGKNESVASVAKRYNLAASDIADWNRVAASAAFKPGSSIAVYLPARAKPVSVATATQSKKTNRASKGRPVKMARH